MTESILNENLIATFEQSLRQTRNAQNRLMVRLREVESEADRLRTEIEALDNSAEKTEAAIYSILATMGSKKSRAIRDEMRYEGNEPSNDRRIPERYTRETIDEFHSPKIPSREYPSNNYNADSVAYINDRSNRRGVPQVGQNIEPINQRFSDRTITQACTLLLRESGKPLHVNELYNFLVTGGFEFTGKNPTISIAVSLNRNRRFKKVAPGTFDLVMRDASQAAS